MLIQADAALIPFLDKTFHCVVTSPPYWGLRKYKGEQQRVWGGDADCEHDWDEWREKSDTREETKHGKSRTTERFYGDPSRKFSGEHQKHTAGMFCLKCGAWYGALGLEPTPELHIEHMVEIFREIRRVLRDDGVVWLNYGDCFAGSGGENANTGLTAGKHRYRMTDDKTRSNLYRNNPRRTKIAQGNLMMMPHKVAIALQSDGWIVRNDVVWWKRNPMPESVNGWRWERSKKVKEIRHRRGSQQNNQRGDKGVAVDTPYADYEYGDDYVLRKGSWRHTRAHEYIFMLCKSMKYYSNQEAVREGDQVYTRKAGGYQGHENPDGSKPYLGKGGFADSTVTTVGRNPRSVLDVPTAPYKGAHYATFPPKLIAPLIRASCPKRCCPECGAPWVPVVEKQVGISKECPKTQSSHEARGGAGKPIGTVGKSGSGRTDGYTNVTDYRPTCSCDCGDHIPGIVLDPFIGSGTTGAVARELGRRWVGLDISMEYLDQQAKIRALKWTPSDALVGLPLFEGLNDEKDNSA